MQIVLLLITVILAVILYRMLSSHRATYRYVRTTRLLKTEEEGEYSTSEPEHGLITVDYETVVVEGQKYSLKSKSGNDAQAILNIESGKLISICTKFEGGEKVYFIDPEHSIFPGNYTEERVSNTSSQQIHIFSF